MTSSMASEKSDAPEGPSMKTGVGFSGNRHKAILDSAERIFASSGFDGASIREIAQKAGVAQALIHYHFDTKEKLFEATTARRAVQINTKRGELLDELLSLEDDLTLEMLVEALFRPTIETGHKLAEDGGSFSRILVSIANSSDPRDQNLTELYYDPIAKRFINAFCQIEPCLSQRSATWAYMFSIGVGMTMMARTGRPYRLSQGQCDDSDVEAMLSEIIIYVCGGIRAMVMKEQGKSLKTN